MEKRTDARQEDTIKASTGAERCGDQKRGRRPSAKENPTYHCSITATRDNSQIMMISKLSQTT